MKKKILLTIGFIAILSLLFRVFPAQAETLVNVYNLQPDFSAIGGGGVYSAYYGPPAHDPVSPGSTAIFDGREAGIIKAGQGPNPGPANWDEGLFAFKPTVTINEFASDTLTYDVETEAGVNPVWMTIEIDTGVLDDRSDNTTYQFVPPTNPAGWNIFNAGDGLWQKWNNNEGDTTGNPLISLGDVAAAHAGLNVIRTYLRLGMGDTYYNGGTGTTAWVDKASLGGVIYDFAVNPFAVPAECTTGTYGPPIVGTSGSDNINGTSGDDLIFAMGGSDRVDGKGGDDCIVGGDGSDSLKGANGLDVILGGDGSDSIDGGNQNDKLFGQGNSDSIRGGNGADELSGGDGSDSLRGEGGADILDGGLGSDSANGGANIDTCTAEAENQCEL